MNRLSESTPPTVAALVATCAVAAFSTGCAKQVNCEDADIVARVSELARTKAIADLASQCTDKLHGKIDFVRSSCPERPDSDNESCRNACQAWAQGSLKIYASNSETLFSDETVSTKRCRAKIRFSVDYDGGQTVIANVAYVIAPGLPKPQVMLSD